MSDLLRTRSFGQLLRSISANMKIYAPQSIIICGSKFYLPAVTLILGQAPGLLTRRSNSVTSHASQGMNGSG